MLWVALSLIDANVTYLCLRSADNIEGNPIARVLLSYNEAAFYGVKVAITLLVGAGFLWLVNKTKYTKSVVNCLTALVVVFAIIVGNNVLHL